MVGRGERSDANVASAVVDLTGFLVCLGRRRGRMSSVELVLVIVIGRSEKCSGGSQVTSKFLSRKMKVLVELPRAEGCVLHNGSKPAVPSPNTK